MLKLGRKKHVCSEIVFKDSFNFLSQKLESLPKTLGLSVQPKLFFPHGFNKPENMFEFRDSLPDPEYYFPEHFETSKKREEFDRFYSENMNQGFLLAWALKEYCGMLFFLRTLLIILFVSENDVVILAAGMIKFQRLFKDLSDFPSRRLDIIPNCLTIASSCISFFLANYVEHGDERFAIVPAGGGLANIEKFVFLNYHSL